MRRTKKIIVILFTTLFTCLCMLFSGCQFSLLLPSKSGNTDTVPGIYKVKSVSATQNDSTQEVHVGETVDGFTLTEDYMKIILTENGYAVLDTQVQGGGVFKATWSQSEEGKIILSSPYGLQEIVLEYDGSMITFRPMESLKIVLEKKAVTLSETQAQAMGHYQLKSVINAKGESINAEEHEAFSIYYDWSLIITEDGCAYFFEKVTSAIGTWTQAENGKLSISVAFGETDVLVGACDGTKITATLDGKTYVFEK